MSTVIKNDLKYTNDHEWAKLEGDVVTFGITDFAQSSLGDIVFLELPEINSTIDRSSACGVIESIKAVNDLCAPVSGTVIETNTDAEGSPENCNTDPYSTWLVKVKINNKNEFNSLMNADQYKDHCENSH